MLCILREDTRYMMFTPRALKSLRLKHRFLFQNSTLGDQEFAAQIAHDIVLQHLKTGQSARYGITYAHTIARMTAKTFISQDLVASTTRQLDPIGVAARTANTHRQRSRFRVKGPNRVWSVDGHDKLSEFGFEIYGIIDGYSRFIINVYVGLGTR
jgi:transposase InsO family protein